MNYETMSISPLGNAYYLTKMTSDNTAYYDMAYNDAINDPRADIETVNTSWTGIAITTVAASSSMLGSAIIIFLILRSTIGLNTVYHRILFGMSVSDILQSFPMILTTMPMPKDMIYTQFDGRMVFGNTITCSIQGATYSAGTMCALLYNAILCIYYVCSIRFRMKDETFRRCLEPCLHIYAILFSLVVTILPWYYEQFNPSPVHFTWCGYNRYPWWCSEHDEECSYERGQPDKALILFAIINMNILFITACIIISMVVIIWHVYSQERLLKSYMDANNATSQGNYRRMSTYRSDIKYTQEVVFQALMYTLVFFAVWHHPLMNAVANRDRGAPYESNRAEETARLVLRPLQGFFNAIIFIHHKVRNFRRDDDSLSFYEALMIVFDREEDEPQHIVSNLTLVKRDVALGRLQFAFDERYSSSDDDEDCLPEAIEMEGSLDGGRAFDFPPDQSVEMSARDLDGFSQDLSFGQVSVKDDTSHRQLVA